MKKVSVFCGSSSRVPDIFYREAEELGRILAREGIEILFGGGDFGLMDHLYKGTVENHGMITGIIPEFMVEAGWAHKELTDLVVVKDMHERKYKLIRETDGIIALPGGPGTLEELSEAITSKQLGLITVPIVLVNIDDYFEPLLRFFEKMEKHNFIRPDHRKMWSVIPHVSSIVQTLHNAPGWDANAIGMAKI